MYRQYDVHLIKIRNRRIINMIVPSLSDIKNIHYMCSYLRIKRSKHKKYLRRIDYFIIIKTFAYIVYKRLKFTSFTSNHKWYCKNSGH